MVTLGSGAKHIVTIQTSSTPPHMIWKVKSSAQGTIALYEVAVSSGGTALTVNNHNRLSSNVSDITFVQSSTVTTTGTTIAGEVIGSGQQGGGEVRSENEWILKTDTKYAFFILSTAASNEISYMFSFYVLGD